MTLGAFAETASEHWSRPANALAGARSMVRSVALTAAACVWTDDPDIVRCLYGHAVFPEHRATFREFLRDLKSIGDVVTTRTLLEIVASGKVPLGRYFHLSFDDGFANAFEVAAEELAAERIPATMFVTTDFVGADYDTVARYFRKLRSYGRPVRIATWAQIYAAAAAGLEIGSHTRSHTRLSCIDHDGSQLRDEITVSKHVIEEKLGRFCESFAWPFGTMADIGPAGFAAIKAAGYTCCFTAVRGRILPGKTDPFIIPRHHVEFPWPRSHIRLWARDVRES
jgi:peptidoglycan/xylan/chitin deacetylase (PgdA/CDA1 family)